MALFLRLWQDGFKDTSTMHRNRLHPFIATLLLSCFLAQHAFAMHAFTQDYVRLSQVVDNAQLMNEKVRKEMLELADDTEYATGVKMIIVTVAALPPNWKPELYAQYAAKQFGIADTKPGVLLLVSKAEAKVGFSMAAGMQGMLTKKILANIMKHEITPELETKDFQQAIRKGTNALSAALQGGYKTPAEKRKQYLPFAILLPVVILMQVLFGNGSGARLFGGGAWRRW